MLTPEEINGMWSFLGKIGVIMACVVGIIKSYKYLRSQTAVAKLESITAEHTKCLNTDKSRLDIMSSEISNIDKRLDKIDKDREEENKRINESLQMLGTSLTAILNHMIDGNGKDQMIKERNELQKFFIQR